MKRTTALLGAAALAAMVAAAPASAANLKAAYFVSPKHPIGVGYQFLADADQKRVQGHA